MPGRIYDMRLELYMHWVMAAYAMTEIDDKPKIKSWI